MLHVVTVKISSLASIILSPWISLLLNMHTQ